MLKEVKEAIEKFKKGAEHFATTMMENLDCIQPTLLVLKQREGKYQFGIVDNIHEVFNNDDKRYFVSAIKQIIKEEKPIAIAIVTEAWMVKRDKGEEYLKGKVSEQPDKVEVVVVQVETVNEESNVFWEILRDGDKPTLKEMDRHISNKNDSRHEGSFQNLLKENYEEFHGKLVNTLTKNVN